MDRSNCLRCQNLFMIRRGISLSSVWWNVSLRKKSKECALTQPQILVIVRERVNLEKLLGHDLLHIVCRHLILENCTGAAFDEALGFLSVSVQLIKQVKNSKVNMQPLLLLILKTKNWCSWDKHWRRNEQGMMTGSWWSFQHFLGAPRPCGTWFAAPGALHHTRWIVKAIYTFKVWMFKSYVTCAYFSP